MPKRSQAVRPNDSGFTLVELLVVIVVLGVLVSIVVFGVAQFRGDSESTACEADAKIVRSAASAYELQQGSYPDNEAALVVAGYIKDPPLGVAYTFDQGTKTVTQEACAL